jgi:hypothetical protein
MVRVRYKPCEFQGVYQSGKTFYYKIQGTNPQLFSAATVKELTQMLRANQIPLIKRKMKPRAKAKSRPRAPNSLPNCAQLSNRLSAQDDLVP